MTFDLDDTIAAIASPAGGARRAVVRISGPLCLACLEQVYAPDGATTLTELKRSCVLDGRIHLPLPLGDIPARLYLWPTNRSYTRQPLAELHTIGSPPLLEAMLSALSQAGARMARPGEFTLRAFLAGRIDLTQAEAVLGVIDAQGPCELNAALSQLAGGLATPLAKLRGDLLDLLAQLEAGLDFVEEDIEFISAEELLFQLAAIAESVAAIAAQMASRSDSSGLTRVVLIGEPNSGKSSLLNALAGRDSAIVSDVAGTTRDYVTVRIKIGTLECLLVDTAGIEPKATSIAASAQSQAAEQARQADLIILCLDGSRDLTAWEAARRKFTSIVQQIVVSTKCDLPSFAMSPGSLPISSVTGTGVPALAHAIALALHHAASETSMVAGTAVRCRESLSRAAASLQRACIAAQDRAGEELIAAEIRGALEELSQVVGAVYTDDVLDRIFSRFCIGK